MKKLARGVPGGTPGWGLGQSPRITLPLLLALSACGGSGKSTSTGGSPATQGPTTLQPGVKAVTGQFFLGTATQPAAGYEIWLFDHTGDYYTRTLLDDQGSFSMPVTAFTQDHTYSFHLVRNFQLIGDIDLAPNTPGVQPAFVYKGGYGFDLGQIIVALDKRGLPSATGGLSGQIGGGFGLDTTDPATFGSFPLPSWVSSLQVGSQLLVTDAETELYSFIGYAVNPSLYARDLQRLSRMGFAAVANPGSKIVRAFVLETGDWIAAARLPGAPDMAPEASPLWGMSGDLKMAGTDPTRFETSVFITGLPPAATVASLRVEPDDGTANGGTANGEASVGAPLTLPRLVAMPPTVVAAAADGTGLPLNVDYATAGAPNGLSRPFCQTGDVTLVTSPPLDDAFKTIPATALSRVDVFFDYFATTDGRTIPLKVTGDQLPAPYNAAVTDSSITDLKRDWDPTMLRLRFTLGPTQNAAASQTLQIWSALLPASLKAGTVAKVRLRIVYGSDAEATQGGTVVWLRKDC